ncbi:hypothetical protein [Nocardia huaxiensis]|uniref:Low molecular weight antigen MTB12-like C-terminal domain-containing protein n=1 Tax=Nocardia huaxiensis TaxID=2755382 RepID=A0A7D6ZF66_9NOCA|nr:hypothetical protein [Nocardia huaxiensis]QLY29519.1 hypothetical protein H0264_30350 [Nocardia huaxiensis]UFS96923.1 hypothetical protein LPY97_03035 [Nocardia huaxiensis]
MNIQHKNAFLLAATGVALSLTLTACGGSNVRNPDSVITVAPTTTAATTMANGKLPDPLTAEQLDQKLQNLFGKKEVSDDQRLAVVQNGEKFRSDLPSLVKAMNENPNATFGVVPNSVVLNGDTLEAEFWLDKDGNGNRRSAPLNLVAANGEWKITSADICGLLAQTDYKSPACS